MTAVTNSFLGHGHVLGVFISDDYAVTQWTEDIISAELHQLAGAMSYLHIEINDEAPDKVQVINISKSVIAKPGEWITEVMTVDFDPAVVKELERK